MQNSSNQKHIERKAAWLPVNPDHHPDIVKLLRNYPRLDLETFGLEYIDINKPFYLGNEVRSEIQKNYYSICEIVDYMKRTYCGNVGVEIVHLENAIHREWLLHQFGMIYGPNSWSISKSKDDKIKILRRLMECDHTAIFFGKVHLLLIKG